MKKLMVLGLAMASAMVVSASNFRWDAETGFLKNGKGDDSKNIEANATAYLFDSKVFSQQALLTSLTDGTYDSLAKAFAAKGVYSEEPVAGGDPIKHYAPTLSVDEGKFYQSDIFVYGTAGTDYTFYMAVIAKDVDGYVFISDLADPARATTFDVPTDVGMNSMSNPSKLKFDTTTFADAGWYTVPEPTSGLLLLIGVAGLALRRRRA